MTIKLIIKREQGGFLDNRKQIKDSFTFEQYDINNSDTFILNKYELIAAMSNRNYQYFMNNNPNWGSLTWHIITSFISQRLFFLSS